MEMLSLITLSLTFLALVPMMESQIKPPVLPIPKTPRPLCASQLALVNYACSRLPFSPGVPPDSPSTPPSPGDDDDNEEGQRNNNNHNSSHRHGHRHGHKRRHHHQQTPDEDNCCRWAKEVDNQCVCEILARLPPFLIRPLHQYTLNIGESCDITYSCGAPI